MSVDMFAIFTLSLLCLACAQVRAQGLLTGLTGIRGQQNPIDQLPGVGACDRIASRGVANCMENFLPTSVLSSFTGGPRGNSGGNICCSYSKYKACIAGLHDGLRLAMQRQRCPKSYSTQIIKSLGDSSVGLPVRSFCDNNNSGKSQCPKSSGKGKKKKQKRRPQNRENRGNDDPIGGVANTLGGLNPLNNGGLNGGGLGNLNPLNGGGLGGLANPLGGLTGGGLGGLNPLGSNQNPIQGLFGGNRGGDGNSRNKRGNGNGNGQGSGFGNGNGNGQGFGQGNGQDFLNPVKDLLGRGAETFQQGMSGILNGAQSFLGGFGGVGGNGGNGRNRGSDYN